MRLLAESLMEMWDLGRPTLTFITTYLPTYVTTYLLYWVDKQMSNASNTAVCTQLVVV